MTKTVYESPSTNVLELRPWRVFLSSGESAKVITGYKWDEDEE